MGFCWRDSTVLIINCKSSPNWYSILVRHQMESGLWVHVSIEEVNGEIREHTHYYIRCMGRAMGLGFLGFTVDVGQR